MKRVRAAIAFTLLLASATASLAQTSAATQSAPEVIVVSSDWKYAGYQRAETTKGYDSAKSKDGSYKVARATVYVFKYTARAVFKNIGTKAIKAISWDYVFTDQETGKEIRRFKIQSKQQILPAATESLSKDVAIDPKEDTRTLNSGKQSIEITRIEYADGSQWRRP